MGWGVEAEPPGDAAQLGDDSPQVRLEAARFRGSELGRDDEGLKAVQRLADSLQTPLAVGGESRASRVRLRLGSHEAEGVVQEGAPFGSVGEPIGGQQDESLGELESVTFDGAQKRLLLAGREGTQGVRERRADACLCNSALGEGGQPCCDIHSPCHPLGLAP